MLGTLRVTLLVPILGELAAVLLELPVMLAVSYLACRWLVRRFQVPARAAERLTMGAIAFACLMLGEAALAVAVFGQSLPAFLATFSQTPARLGLAGQLVFAVMPLIVSMKR